MKSHSINSGLAIALAWPQTFCKQPGAWYDPLTLFLGFNQNNYYRVGHAALVLIDSNIPKAYYFDFGRYHAPYQQGRVRSAGTDHDLEIKTTPVLSADGTIIDNIWEILYELQQNAACHGEGELHASYAQIDFQSAFDRVQQMQADSPMPYGPFIHNGSNCSRFVRSALKAGKLEFRHWLKLSFWLPLTPTPRSNVVALDRQVVVPKLLKGEAFYPVKRSDRMWLTTTLPAPLRHPNVPKNATWHSGEGAGSWFALDVEDGLLKVSRYSPLGLPECSGYFANEEAMRLLQVTPSFSLTYPSNCQIVSLRLNGSDVRFRRVL